MTHLQENSFFDNGLYCGNTKIYGGKIKKYDKPLPKIRNYNDLIPDDRLLIINGVGRSGTTILGTLIASLRPVFYVFEPALIKYCTDLSVLKGVLYEDYFLREIHGRGNTNPYDDTYCINYMTKKELHERRVINRKNESIEKYKKLNPLFVVKTTEYDNLFLSNVKRIDIIRNGFDVIQSAVNKGWYTDDYCNKHMVYRHYPHWLCNVPVLDGIDHETIVNWPNYSPLTRAACVWRICVNKITCQPKFIRYEDFDPRVFTLEFMQLYDLKGSEKTTEVMKLIESYERTNYQRNENILNKIEEPERDSFIFAMESLGYL